MSNEAHPYEALTPDVMLDAVETFGVRCDGSFLALNSYENRVYQIGLEDGDYVVVKFYRDDRGRRSLAHVCQTSETCRISLAEDVSEPGQPMREE